MTKAKKKPEAKDTKMGRPIIKLDMALIENLCALQCTAVEIAEAVGCSEDTLGRRIKEEHGVTFAEYFKLKRQPGLSSLRRTQFKLAKRSAGMAIFLGKNLLGQKDRSELHMHGGLNINKELKEMTTDELIRECKRHGITVPD